MLRTALPLVIAFVSLPAHAGWIADAGYTTGFRGKIGFEDARHDLDGERVRPASPVAGDADVTVEVYGDASWDGLLPDCGFLLGGEVSGLYEGEGRVSEDGAYIAAFNENEASFVADAGCLIEDLTLDAVSGAYIRAELEATYPQCEAFCAAAARSEAEGMCGASPDAAECRLAEEASIEASCMVSCTEEASYIVGEAEVSGGAMATINRGLSGEGWGVARTHIRVDHMEDAEGDEVEF